MNCGNPNVKFLCVSAADFGRPVVPLVAVKNAIVSSVSKSVGLEQSSGCLYSAFGKSKRYHLR